MSAAPRLTGPRLASTRRSDAAFEGTRWRPVRRLGAGGMGAVWEVEHVELGRRAALKVLHPEHRAREEYADRLRDEACTLARLRHRAIPDVLDLGTLSDGRPYFVMQLVTGRDLRSELDRLGVASVPTTARWMAEVLEALQVVHDAGFVHRDVKLENVLLDPSGAASLIDFGVAVHVEAALRRTGRGRLVGTLRSMSPEQHALIDVDHRADLYAVGLCIFELLTGQGPFDAEQPTPAAMHYAHCRRTPPRLGEVAPQLVPAALEDVVTRALAKSADERFASAAEMRAALIAAATLPPRARIAAERLHAPTQVSPTPDAPSLRRVLGELADDPPTSSTRVLSSAV
jgi:serine/threonine protein kinase